MLLARLDASGTCLAVAGCAGAYRLPERRKFDTPELNRARVAVAFGGVAQGTMWALGFLWAGWAEGGSGGLRSGGAVRRLEEEMTAAAVRRCPGCSKPFVRSDGCPEVSSCHRK